MKLASGRPWARGPQFYSLLLRLMGVVRSTLRSRHPAPLLPSKISLSNFSSLSNSSSPLRLLQASRYEKPSPTFTVVNAFRIWCALEKFSIFSPLSNFPLSPLFFPTYTDGIIFHNFHYIFAESICKNRVVSWSNVRERNVRSEWKKKVEEIGSIRSRRDFGMVENKAKHGKVKVCCERNEGGEWRWCKVSRGRSTSADR